jgi:hypothetical protein
VHQALILLVWDLKCLNWVCLHTEVSHLDQATHVLDHKIIVRDVKDLLNEGVVKVLVRRKLFNFGAENCWLALPK